MEEINDTFIFDDEDNEYSYNYIMARIENIKSELWDLSDYLGESDFVNDVGLDKFRETKNEVNTLNDKVESLVGSIIKIYLDNGLMKVKEL